jgi:MFS family permease
VTALPRTDTRSIIATSVVATVGCVYPGFLVGAVSVQVKDEFEISAGRYGWAMGTYFLAAAFASILGGRLVQRIGPRRQLIACLLVTIVAQSLIASIGDSFGVIVALLAVCGVVNAANQTAVNLALTRARLPRLGLAIAIKQSGMPSAAMISGATVPLLALTLGWRSAFVLGAGIAAVGLVMVARFIEPGGVEVLRSAKPVSSSRALYWSLIGGSFLSFSAGGLTSWLVASGVDAGLSEGMAGWLLSLGAAFGISARLFWGVRNDAMTARPYSMAALMAAIGAVGMLGLAPRIEALHVASTFLAFAAGWSWPVFTNFGIMRANGDAAGAASGITQMGIYLGVFAGPLVTGWTIDEYGYGTMWTLVAVCMLIGAGLTYWIRAEF